jgi:hypothetical protein
MGDGISYRDVGFGCWIQSLEIMICNDGRQAMGGVGRRGRVEVEFEWDEAGG